MVEIQPMTGMQKISALFSDRGNLLVAALAGALAMLLGMTVYRKWMKK